MARSSANLYVKLTVAHAINQGEAMGPAADLDLSDRNKRSHLRPLKSHYPMAFGRGRLSLAAYRVLDTEC